MAARPMPGIVVAIRVLLFLSAAYGIIVGGLGVVGVLTISALDSAEIDRALAEQGAGSVGSMWVGAFGALIYGIASLVLGIILGKATSGIRWGVVGAQVFYILVALVVMLMGSGGAAGGAGLVIGIAIPVIIGILAQTKGSRAYFTDGNAQGYPAY